MEPTPDSITVARPAQWQPERPEVAAAREEAIAEVVVWTAIAAGLLNLAQAANIGVISLMRCLLLMLACGIVVPVLYVRFVKPLRKARLRILSHRLQELGVHETCKVEIRVLRNGAELGLDSGLLWQDGSLLNYEGARTCWAVSTRDLRRLETISEDPVRVNLELNAGGCPILVEIRAVPGQTERGRVLQMLEDWTASESGRPSLVFPPVLFQDRNFRWYLEAAVRRKPMWFMPALAVMMSTNLFRSGPLHDKLWWITGVVLIHGLLFSYWSVRRQDEADRVRVFAEHVGTLDPDTVPGVEEVSVAAGG